VQTGFSTGEDRYTLQFYVEEDPQDILCIPTFEEWTKKQNHLPTTFTEHFVEEEVIIYHPCRDTRQHRFYTYRIQGVENTAPFENPHYPIHPHRCERSIDEAVAERKDYKRFRQWVTNFFFICTLYPHYLIGIYYFILNFWSKSTSDTKEYIQVTNKLKDSKIVTFKL
jgi:hypothetical protein